MPQVGIFRSQQMRTFRSQLTAGNVATSVSARDRRAVSAGGTVAAWDDPVAGADAGCGPPPAVPRTTSMPFEPAPAIPSEAGACIHASAATWIASAAATARHQ